MIKSKLIHLITICFVLIYSCKKNPEKTLHPQWDYKNIIAIGDLKSDTYTFCSVVPQVITYDYKVGNWVFYSPQKVKIAAGKFDVEYTTIDDHGGCLYSFYSTTMDPKKWEFWDSNGKPIPTNKRDLDFILRYRIDTNH